MPADIIRGMRRRVCTFLIFLSFFQWSWAGAHAAFEVANAVEIAVAHAAAAAHGTATTDALESTDDCAAQSHCCHPHSLGVPGEVTATPLSVASSDIAEHLALRPADISFNNIERPKWLPALMAAAVL